MKLGSNLIKISPSVFTQCTNDRQINENPKTTLVKMPQNRHFHKRASIYLTHQKTFSIMRLFEKVKYVCLTTSGRMLHVRFLVCILLLKSPPPPTLSQGGPFTITKQIKSLFRELYMPGCLFAVTAALCTRVVWGSGF